MMVHPEALGVESKRMDGTGWDFVGVFFFGSRITVLVPYDVLC